METVSQDRTPLDAATPVTRFVFDANGFAATRERIKFKEFMPAWDEERQEFVLSTYRIDGLSEQEIWQHSKEHVEPGHHGRTAKVRGDLSLSSYESVELTGDPDNVPPRHVSILGWPDEEHKQLTKAKLLDTMFLSVGRFVANPVAD